MSESEKDRVRNVANSVPVNKQASADLMAIIIEMVIAITGFVLKLLVVAFQFAFKGLIPSSLKSQKKAAKPSKENEGHRVLTEYERSQRQIYENDKESKENSLRRYEKAFERASQHGEIKSFKYDDKKGSYTVVYRTDDE